MGCALVIIARDRPDLWMTWAAFYGGAATVEVSSIGGRGYRARRGRTAPTAAPI